MRLKAGINHRGNGQLNWDGRVLSDLDFWRMDVSLNDLDIWSPSLSGILGETVRPVHNGNGRVVMEGSTAFSGHPLPPSRPNKNEGRE